MFKKIFAIIVIVMFLFAECAFAGFSGGRSSFGGGGSRSFSSPSRSSYSAPSRTYSSPTKSYSTGSKSTGTGSRSIFGGSSSPSKSGSSSSLFSTSSSGSTGSKSTFSYKPVTPPTYSKSTTYTKPYKLPSDWSAPSRSNFHYYGGNDGFMDFAVKLAMINALTESNSSDKAEAAKLKAEMMKDPKYKEYYEMALKEQAYKDAQAQKDESCFINSMNN